MRSVIAGIIGVLLLMLGGCMGPTGTRGGHYGPKEWKNIPYRPDRAADKVVIKQSAHRLYVYQHGKVIKTFPISLGKKMKEGAKVKANDFRTPIGHYTILNKRVHPIKYRAMTISYPNAQDIAKAKALGVDPGSYITFHGQPYWNRDGHGDSYTLKHDWTNGCIALTNKDLDWLWSAVKPGTPVIIEP